MGHMTSRKLDNDFEIFNSLVVFVYSSYCVSDNAVEWLPRMTPYL